MTPRLERHTTPDAQSPHRSCRMEALGKVMSGQRLSAQVKDVPASHISYTQAVTRSLLNCPSDSDMTSATISAKGSGHVKIRHVRRILSTCAVVMMGFRTGASFDAFASLLLLTTLVHALSRCHGSSRLTASTRHLRQDESRSRDAAWQRSVSCEPFNLPEQSLLPERCRGRC